MLLNVYLLTHFSNDVFASRVKAKFHYAIQLTSRPQTSSRIKQLAS